MNTLNDLTAIDMEQMRPESNLEEKDFKKALKPKREGRNEQHSIQGPDSHYINPIELQSVS